MSKAKGTLGLWQTFASMPVGKWLFSRIICLKAPFFSSIRPQFVELRPEYCEVSIRNRRAVHNHIGTVHAIAMCNMAELSGGMMTEVTIPSTHRWIPKGMTVEYLKKAGTDLRAMARPLSLPDWSQPVEFQVEVRVQDTAGQDVFRAVISMWVTPKA